MYSVLKNIDLPFLISKTQGLKAISILIFFKTKKKEKNGWNGMKYITLNENT